MSQYQIGHVISNIPDSDVLYSCEPYVVIYIEDNEIVEEYDDEKRRYPDTPENREKVVIEVKQWVENVGVKEF